MLRVYNLADPLPSVKSIGSSFDRAERRSTLYLDTVLKGPYTVVERGPMCLCILAHQLISTHPHIIAANREERYDRPTDAPNWQDGIFAGRDRLAGGTWQGVNSMGLHVALTNRRGDLADPARRSRGQLCADALRHASARAACDWVLDHLLHVRYNPCNLLFSDGIDAFCIHYDGHGARAETLKAGLHLLSDTDVNDPEHPRIIRTRKAFENIPHQMPNLLDGLGSLMAKHSSDESGLCLHGTRGGTRSSTIILLNERTLDGGHFHWAEGPPCSTAYIDLSQELCQSIRE